MVSLLLNLRCLRDLGFADISGVEPKWTVLFSGASESAARPFTSVSMPGITPALLNWCEAR
jgi:hypothetical protein